MCCAGAWKKPPASWPIRAGADARSARSPSPGVSTAPRISAAASASDSACRRAPIGRKISSEMDKNNNPVLWQPSTERIARSALTAFADFARVRHGAPPATADMQAGWLQLHEWSVQQRVSFWSALWEHAGVIGERGTAVLEHGTRMPGARWFGDSRLNYAETLLSGDGGASALLARNENGARVEMTRGQQRQAVLAAAAGLAAARVGQGDVVAGFVAHTPEAVIAMLATTHLGAVWTSVSPEFGAAACVERFGQTGAKLLIATTSYFYAGKRHD